jgi:hypothetical protein
MLRGNTILKELDLCKNLLGDDFATLLAPVLSEVHLLSLKLNGNNIGDVGSKAFANGLVYNVHLQYLGLGGLIGDQGK